MFTSSPPSGRFLVASAAALLLVAGSALTGWSGAEATSTPTPRPVESVEPTPDDPGSVTTPTPTPTSTPLSPSLTVDLGDDAFFAGAVAVSGTKTPGRGVQIDGIDCAVPLQSRTFTCEATLPDGGHALTFTETDGEGEAIGDPLTRGIRVLSAPTLDGGDPVVTRGPLEGSGYPGAGVFVSVGDRGQVRCAVVDGNGRWRCEDIAAPTGDYPVSVQQSWPGADGDRSASSAPRTVSVQRLTPPSVQEPAGGASLSSDRVTVSGVGEEGATVQVFVDRGLVCSAAVAGGRWSCDFPRGGDGEHAIEAVQTDAAGTTSGLSSPVTVRFSTPVPAPRPEDEGEPSVDPTTDPTTAPADPTEETDETDEEPAQQPTTSPLPTVPPDGSDTGFAPPVGGDAGAPPGQTWGVPTGYGAAIPALGPSLSGGALLAAALLALAFLALVAWPSRLLVAGLADRIGGSALLARGRADGGVGDRTLSWPTVVGAFAAAALLAGLAGGLQAEARFARLALAIGLAIVVLNVVGLVVPSLLVGAATRSAVAVRLAPTVLVIGAVSALVSRGGGIQPPLIVGALLATAFVAEVPARRRAALGAAQLVSVAGLGTLAWAVHAASGPVQGFWPVLLDESLAVLALTALGSLPALLLPVFGMPGRALFDAAPAAWAGAALVGVTISAAMLTTSPRFPAPLVLALAGACAIVCVSVWAWTRLAPRRGRRRA